MEPVKPALFANVTDSMLVLMKKLSTWRMRFASALSLLEIRTRVPQSKNSTGLPMKECSQLTWYVKTAESSELQKLEKKENNGKTN